MLKITHSKPFHFFIFLLLILLLGLTGCSSSQPQADIGVQSVSYLNPDPTGRPSPVVVNMYELASDSAFKNASYAELTNRSADVLGNDLLDKRMIEVRPGQKMTVTEPISPNTKYLGITADFRNIALAQWRTIVAVPPGKSTVDLSIVLESQRVMATVNH